MINRFLMFVLALMPIASSIEGAPLDHIKSFFTTTAVQPAPTIKVLIVHDRPGVILEVKGRYKLFDPRANSYLSTRFIGKRKFIQATNDGLRWGEEFPGLHQLLIAPESSSVTTIIDGIEYQGSVYVYDVEGKISVVNEVNIEDYLKSALARRFLEKPDSDEALAAAVIAARTNAYYHSHNPPSPYWAVDAQQTGYQGFAVTGRNLPVENAIYTTRYIILQDNGQPFPASWEQNADKAAVASRISLEEANEMAKRKDNAAQILSKAFPGSSMLLIYHDSK